MTTRIHGIDDRRAIDWRPILTAAHDLARGGDDAAALGGALGRLLGAIPAEVLRERLEAKES